METVKRFNGTMEETLTAKLTEVGLSSEPVTVTKNGIECMGIRVIDPVHPNISPIVYYSQEETIDAVMHRISEAIRNNPAQVCIDQLTDPAYIAEHIYMTIQRCGKDAVDVLKKPHLNLELVLRVSLKLGDGTGSVKVSGSMLELADMSEDVAWTMARHNMRKRLHIRSMAEMLGLPEDLAGGLPMAVCTTAEKTDGAVGLAFPELFSAFCDSFESEGAYLLPSSTEELIVIPDNIGHANAHDMVNMVREINGSMVDPLIQLDPVVYRYDSHRNDIAIVATLQNGGAM